MSIELIVEVLDRYHGPHSRKLWLIAWAEKVNNDAGSRTGFCKRTDLADRLGVSSARVSQIARELEDEGVIKRLGGGWRGKITAYELLPLAAAKGKPRADPIKGKPRANAKGKPRANAKGKPWAYPNPHNPQEPSSLSARARDQRQALAAAGLDADEREIELIIAGIYDDPDIKHPDAYLRRCIASDGGAGLLADARRTNPRVILARIGADDDEAGFILAEMAAAGISDPARSLREKFEEDEGNAKRLLDRARRALAALAAGGSP